MKLLDCVLGLLDYLVVEGYNATPIVALSKFFYLRISVIILMRGPELFNVQAHDCLHITATFSRPLIFANEDMQILDSRINETK
jgi:hypothetical protein